jgi:hypothetical protein
MGGILGTEDGGRTTNDGGLFGLAQAKSKYPKGDPQRGRSRTVPYRDGACLAERPGLRTRDDPRRQQSTWDICHLKTARILSILQMRTNVCGWEV